jgi:hypothetical protein
MSKMSVLSVVAVAAALMAGVSFGAVRAQQPLQVIVDANNVWIRAGDSPILRYRYGDVPFKPYVKELYTPSGLNVLLDAPPDHLHHHGLMFAVAVNGVNFWEETPTAGRQTLPVNSVMITIDKDEADSHARFILPPAAWFSEASDTSELLEARTITACHVKRLGATVITWQTELANVRAGQSVVLSGSHYFGLGMRFVRAMDGGEFFNADDKEGKIFRGEEKLVQSNWCAYTATIDGKPVTVAMLGHPDNLRHPTTWFTMAKPFAYLSGTLNLHEQPLSIEVGKALVLRYAVVVWDGKVTKGRIDEAYQWFASDYPAPPSVFSRTPKNDPNR